MDKSRRVERPNSGDLVVRGLAFAYLGFMVALPILALVVLAFQNGPLAFWTEITRREAVTAMVLTFEMAVIATLITTLTGIWIAWTLKRREFIGKRLLESLIDLPLALPAIVAGLVLLSLYGPQGFIGSVLEHHGIQVLFAKPGIVLALMFVTLPLMVRSIQPIMDELDPEAEQASFTLGASRLTTFIKITLPILWPSIAAGASLTVARALGEFGSLVLIAGNIPYKTEIAPTYVYGRIESGTPEAASSVAVALLVVAVFILLAIEYLQSRSRKVRRPRGR